MAAHALDDLFEAVELEDRRDTSIENDADDETRSPVMPPQPPPVVNTYEQVTNLALATRLPSSSFSSVDLLQHAHSLFCLFPSTRLMTRKSTWND